jgi:tRNA threonylcarbamoyladenosine biosynthesis protein TsaB
MSTDADGLLVAFDTASDLAGVALMENGQLLAEATWRSRQNHSREMLPTLEWLLQRHGRGKHDLAAVAVCLGPGSYAGLRVGISTAKALAYGLELPVVGVGRLEADALEPAAASGGRVVAVQIAGRAEVAWAAYKDENGTLRELTPPGLIPAEGLADAIQPGDLLCGDAFRLDAAVVAALVSRGARVVEVATPRVASVARLGYRRLRSGAIDNPDTLVPLYLRAPAIGPPKPR